MSTKIIKKGKRYMPAQVNGMAHKVGVWWEVRTTTKKLFDGWMVTNTSLYVHCRSFRKRARKVCTSNPLNGKHTYWTPKVITNYVHRYFKSVQPK